MEAVKKVFGVIHFVLAIVVGVQFVVSPLYDAVPVWEILNWGMAIGVIAGVIFSYMRWTSARESDHGERVGSGAMLIGAVAVLLLFFEQWFATRLFPLDDAGWVTDRINLWWQVVNVIFVIVSGEIGMYLLGIGHHSDD